MEGKREIGDQGSFNANMDKIRQLTQEYPEDTLHSFMPGNVAYTACGLPVELKGQGTLPDIYFMAATIDEVTHKTCLNCETLICVGLFHDMVERAKIIDEEMRGGDPWKLPPMSLN